MVNVIAWPPVYTTGHEFTVDQPISQSRSLLSHRRYVSQAMRKRKVGMMEVTGRGTDLASSGYVEMLKEQLQGGVHLVRIDVKSAIWYRAGASADLRAGPIAWTAGAVEPTWTAGAVDLLWVDGFTLLGTPTTDAGWPAVSVTGLPPNRIVARPSEYITVTDPSDTVQRSRVLTIARSDAAGNATIRIESAFTISGRIGLGGTESLVFAVDDMPRAVQPVTGEWSYSFAFTQMFQDEFAATWTEIDPWR